MAGSADGAKSRLLDPQCTVGSAWAQACRVSVSQLIMWAILSVHVC